MHLSVIVTICEQVVLMKTMPILTHNIKKKVKWNQNIQLLLLNVLKLYDQLNCDQIDIKQVLYHHNKTEINKFNKMDFINTQLNRG